MPMINRTFQSIEEGLAYTKTVRAVLDPRRGPVQWRVEGVSITVYRQKPVTVGELAKLADQGVYFYATTDAARLPFMRMECWHCHARESDDVGVAECGGTDGDGCGRFVCDDCAAAHIEGCPAFIAPDLEAAGFDLDQTTLDDQYRWVEA